MTTGQISQLTTTGGGGLGGVVPLTVGGSNQVQSWDGLGNAIYPYPHTVGYIQVVEPPRVCSDDVHVFPCPHCDKCKCGAATVKRAKAKK